ncbi:MAG: hypothetical protein QG654_573 [Patescibacteria group bacterium]|nr:hypothetical protein [Patescibacteria group bacterium]
MERYKEKLELKKEQNLMSFVLMVCFLMLAFSFWGAFSSDHKSVKNIENIDKVVVGKIR